MMKQSGKYIIIVVFVTKDFLINHQSSIKSAVYEMNHFTIDSKFHSLHSEEGHVYASYVFSV